MKIKGNQFKPQAYQSNRGRKQNRGRYQGSSRSNNAYRGCSVYDQDLEVGQDIILIAEVIMVTMNKVIRGMQGTIVIEGIMIEIDFIIEIGVGHLKDRIEVGEMTEVWVTVGQGQVLEQVKGKGKGINLI